jgi:hypothetical protein
VGIVYFFHSGPAVLIMAMIGTNYGRANFAQATGVLYVGVGLLTAFSYFGVGSVLTAFNAYNPTNLLFGAMMVVALILSLMMKDGYIPAPNKEKEISE